MLEEPRVPRVYTSTSTELHEPSLFYRELERRFLQLLAAAGTEARATD